MRTTKFFSKSKEITCIAPYTFSGKEKDAETGYSYFGARYYDSDISVWLSIDPLSDKYPSMSPFIYTAGNPVMLIDPDGRKWKRAKDKKQADKMDAIAKNRISKNESEIAKLQNSEGNEDEIYSLQAQNKDLQNSINERAKMGSKDDPIRYKFKKTKGEAYTSPRKSLFGKKDIIVMRYGDDADAFHEQLHGYKRGKELNDENSVYGAGYSAHEEAAAKRREYSALPKELRNTRGPLFQKGYSFITTENWVARIVEVSSDPKYPNFKANNKPYIRIANDWLKEHGKPLIQ